MRLSRSHCLLLIGLVILLVAIVGLNGTELVRAWMDQNAQREEAEAVAAELDVFIDELEGEVARRTSDGGVRREALCFGPYVAPGTEIYAVMGLEGCVSPLRDP